MRGDNNVGRVDFSKSEKGSFVEVAWYINTILYLLNYKNTNLSIDQLENLIWPKAAFSIFYSLL